jgi:hypothetical protein
MASNPRNRSVIHTPFHTSTKRYTKGIYRVDFRRFNKIGPRKTLHEIIRRDLVHEATFQTLVVENYRDPVRRHKISLELIPLTKYHLSAS